MITYIRLAAFGLAFALLSCACRAAELTAAEVGPWIDGLMSYAISTGDIAGGVVVVVQKGEVLAERGYGFRDVARRLPMDPHSTLIRPGSISKLFTWTAVMQQVEQGRLDLDADVNRYLDFRVPHMTLRQIMTHTSGFEESLKDLISVQAPQPLRDYLTAHLPEVLYPAGQVPAYSNYATALAGYIVTRVAGQTFEAYTDQHILQPLGMLHSTFRQPVPAALAPVLSNGYRLGSGPAQPFEHFAPTPAGALSCTADDMAWFMISHLHAGASLLRPETARAMHTVQRKIYPALNGMALGFYETSRNGHFILAHNGGTQFFHSDLHLFMDDDVGIFISLNSAGKDEIVSRIHDELFHGFADRYFPPSVAEGTASKVPADIARQHAQLLAGAWENSRRSATTLMSLAGLLSPMSIAANEDGTVTVPVPAHGDMRWHEIAPFVWEQVNGVERMQALVVDGRPAMLGFGMAPPAAFLPIPAYRSPAWLLPATAAALLILLLNGLFWPINRRLRVASLVSVAVVVSFPLTLSYLSQDASRLSAASDPWIYASELFALIALLAAIAISATNLRVVSGRRRKIGSILILTGNVVLLWMAVVSHLLNFNTHY